MIAFLKRYAILLSTLISFYWVNAQSEKIDPHKNSFFAELGGPGFGASLNLQHQITENKNSNSLYYRAGLGLLGPIPGRGGASILFTLPLGLQYKFSKTKRWEAGTGITLFYFTNTGFERPGVFISVAYYLQPNIRIMLSPFIVKKSTLNYYFSINQSILPFAGIDIFFNQ